MVANEDGAWPLPSFYFKAEIGSVGKIVCKEVSGLTVATRETEYRHDSSSRFQDTAVKMPGIKKTGNVSLKKGTFAKDGKVLDWLDKIKMGTIEREMVTISLPDQSGAPAMVWKLANAWPVKAAGFSMNPDGSEIAFEAIDLAHEGVTIENE